MVTREFGALGARCLRSPMCERERERKIVNASLSHARNK